MTRRGWIAAGILTLVVSVAFCLLAAPQYLSTGDPEVYVGLARSLARGGPYAINGAVHVKFPPGFPVALVPAAWLFDGAFQAIARYAGAIAAGVFPVVFLWMSQKQKRIALPVAILTIASSRFAVLATGNPMSEAVYMIVSIGMVCWADGWETELPNGRGRWSVLLGAILLLGTIATRTIGAAALVAAGALLVWRMREGVRPRLRESLPLLAGMGFLVGWALWTRNYQSEWTVPGPGTGYLEYLTLADTHQPGLGRATFFQIGSRLPGAVVKQAAQVSELLTQAPWIKPAWYSPALLLVPILGIGWWRSLRTGGGFGAIYFLTYVAIVLVWPFDEGGRFLVPLIPLLWLYVITAGQELGRSAPAQVGRCRLLGIAWSVIALAGMGVASATGGLSMSKQDVLAAGFWALALVALTVGWRPLNRLAARLRDARLPNLTPAAIGLYVALGLVTAGPFILDRARGAPPPPNSTEHHLAVASEWILANTPPASRVQATWSDRINFATGRPTALLPVTEDPAILRKFEEHFHPRYILVLDDPPTPYLKPIDAVRFGLLQEMYPGRWRLAAELTGARVFEVK